MAAECRQPAVLPSDPASPSAVTALEHDPFYRSISASFVDDASRRRAVLTKYFDFSIQEGREFGRSVRLDNQAHGVAVWLLPQSSEVESRAAHAKRWFLETALDEQGCANYYRIVEFMTERASAIVDEDAWYLSIVAVHPSLQGRGLGQKLLAPAISAADRASAVCYLETFSPRNVAFYERLGFIIKDQISEPTTGADYAVMIRYPKPGI